MSYLSISHPIALNLPKELASTIAWKPTFIKALSTKPRKKNPSRSRYSVEACHGFSSVHASLKNMVLFFVFVCVCVGVYLYLYYILVALLFAVFVVLLWASALVGWFVGFPCGSGSSCFSCLRASSVSHHPRLLFLPFR